MPAAATHFRSMNAVITLKEAVELIDRGEIFSCTVCSYDEKRKHKNGRQLHYTQVRAASAKGERGPSRQLTEQEKLRTRAQNHQPHHTRNVVLLQDGIPTSITRKIHLPLLEVVNGRPIVL